MAGRAALTVPVENDPSRHFAATQQFGRSRGEADIERFSVCAEPVAFDPYRTRFGGKCRPARCDAQGDDAILGLAAYSCGDSAGVARNRLTGFPPSSGSRTREPRRYSLLVVLGGSKMKIRTILRHERLPANTSGLELPVANSASNALCVRPPARGSSGTRRRARAPGRPSSATGPRCGSARRRSARRAASTPCACASGNG